MRFFARRDQEEVQTDIKHKAVIAKRPQSAFCVFAVALFTQQKGEWMHMFAHIGVVSTPEAAVLPCYPGLILHFNPDQPESWPASAFNASLCMRPLPGGGEERGGGGRGRSTADQPHLCL